MKDLKKLPRKQLEKFSTIFMQLGLVLTLFIVFVTIEHESVMKAEVIGLKNESTIVHQIDPDRPIIYKKEVVKPKVEPKPEVPKKQILNKEFEKVKNNATETVIISPKDEPKDVQIVDIDNIKTIEDPIENPIEETVPFTSVQKAPVFAGCEGLSEEENRACLDKKMKRLVQRYFDADLANELGLKSGKHRINTEFVIDKSGQLIDIRIRAPHPRLKKEAKRVLHKIPKFTPGMQQNTPVKVRYQLPISFMVQ